MKITLLFIFFALLIGMAGNAAADQPVMDMAPRWEKGYGFQVRQEFYGSDKLIRGKKKISNPLEIERYVRKTWLEGVYTINRAIRATFKLPFVYQKRIKNIDGTGIKQKNSGFGDLVLSVPLKYYRNKGAYTDNFGITPSLRIPTGDSSGDFPITDGSWDTGLSISHSLETPKFYTSAELFYWKNNSGKNGMNSGDEFGFDVDLGYHPYHSNVTNKGVFIMWKLKGKDSGKPSKNNLTTFSGGKLVQTGPILVLYKNNIMFRAEFKHPLYENVDGVSNSRGPELNVGVGIAF